ncbi:hypothetical protein V6N12_019532 [Hibiscus sabdariffa]|uniref:Cytochrome P450 n=1 Tax=Hibiscus sabdariffa TaxID=183260 RepID=A0ABR2BMF2_9ROSI
MEKIILEHKEARKNNGSAGDMVKDVLDILIKTSEDENAEMKLTRENAKAFVMNFFSGGTDTSSVTSGCGLAELMNHPNVTEKAQKEIDSVVGRNRILEESDMENLPYLQAVVKETLRLHPGGPLVWTLETRKEPVSRREGTTFQLVAIREWKKKLPPGASLALQVVPTIIGIMIQCFDWKVGDGEDGTVNMEEKAGVTLLRAHPLVLHPVTRLSPFPSV